MLVYGGAAMNKRARIFAVLIPAATLAVSAVGVSLAQDASQVPGSGGRVYAAELRLGTCEETGGQVVAELALADTRSGSHVGSTRAQVVAESYTESVPLALDATVTADYSLEILSATNGTDARLACGQLSTPTLLGDEAVGLREDNRSGVAGIAYLAPDADDPALTNVSLFITEQTPARTNTEPFASPMVEVVTPSPIPSSSPSPSSGTSVLATPALVASPAPRATSAPDASYAETVLSTPGLVAYWRLDEMDSATVSDASGGGFDGTSGAGIIPGGPSAIAGDDDPSALFSGDAETFVDMGDVLDFADRVSFSLEAWIQPIPTTEDYYGRIVQKEAADAEGQRNGYVLWNQSKTGRIGFERWQNGESAAVSTAEGIPNETWTYVVVTYDGATLRLFLDGMLAASAKADQPLPDTDLPFRIGRGSSGGGAFNGFIDEVAVYDVTLDEGTIASHYRVGTGGRTVSDSAAVATPIGS